MSGMIRVWARAAAIQLEEIAAANATAAAAASTTTNSKPDLRSRNVDAQSTPGEAGMVPANPSARPSSRPDHTAPDLRALHEKIEKAAAARHAELESDQSEAKVVIGSHDSRSDRSRIADRVSSSLASTTSVVPPTKTSSPPTAPATASHAPRTTTSEAPAESSKAAQERAASQAASIDLALDNKQPSSAAERATKRDTQLSNLSTSTGGDAEAAKAAPLLSAAAPDPLPPRAAPTETQSPAENDIPPEHGAMTEQEEEPQVMLRASKVPSSRIGRLFHYGSLAASMSWGAATESLRRTAGGESHGSVFMSDANVRRLVGSLSKMRGAALKLGQFMSIQDNNMLPPEIERVLQQVQAQANYMPDWQMERVMSEELGSEWESLFSSFDKTPIASASIGQVHRATLKSTGRPVAVKIQFPGVKTSIESDLSYLTPLLRSSAALPKGMFLQNTIATMKRELADECDYVMEAEAGRKFRSFLANDPFFVCPEVVDEASTARVLTTTWMPGKPLSKMKGMSQQTRDKIGENILRLCLMELFHFRFMQTDPNWANFLYDSRADKLGLIDFGASRPYSKEFMDGWFRLLRAAVQGDRAEMEAASRDIGYLTGEENDLMVNAHVDSMALLATPFASTEPYSFANQTITDSVRALIPVMLKHRLTPPPPETYSLNRKLSGAFLMCAKLGATVDCHTLWEDYVAGYQVGPDK